LTVGLSVSAPVAMAKDDVKVSPKTIWQRETLTGDWGGARTALGERGIDIGIEYVGETMGVLSGGLRRDTTYEGRLGVTLDADLQKLIGWNGLKFSVTGFQIHNGGRNVAENTGAIADPSNIDALPTTRLFTMWFEQSFAGEMLSVRFGQLAADDEFLVSDTAGGLLNGTFGWAGVVAANMTNGGPAYPMAAPGVRVQLKPTQQLTLLGAVFSGDPVGTGCEEDDPQRCNEHGAPFRFHGGELYVGEAQFAVNQGENAAGLPGVYKFGGWYATADFADQHFGVDPATGAILSLADPAMPDPLNRRGNWGIYALADQMIWRGDMRSLSVFVRGGVSPADRNLIAYYVDGGFGFTGLFPGRPADVFTFGVAYANISSEASALDRDTLRINGPPYPIRDHETVFEFSYAIQIAPSWVVQPDLQIIVHPGGNVPVDPDAVPVKAIKDAVIAGVRSTVTF